MDEPPLDFLSRAERLVKESFGARWDPPTWHMRWDFAAEERRRARDATREDSAQSASAVLPDDEAHDSNGMSVGELAQAEEMASKLTAEELRKFFRTEARAVAYELYQMWQDDEAKKGAPDYDPGPEESSTRSDKKYPDQPPF